MRTAFAILAAMAVAACDPFKENQLVEHGIGTNLVADDIRTETDRLEEYLDHLCRQAGMADIRGQGAGPDRACRMDAYGDAAYTLLVKAGFNDIDRRCDSYLAWLNARRRGNTAVLKQIGQTAAATQAIMRITGSSGTPITLAGLAFGLAADTFTNYYSRLILEVEKSTVEVLVHQKRLQYREQLAQSGKLISFLPDAVHVLREYLLICTPHYIENKVNQRTRDSIAGHTPVDRNDSDQVRRSLSGAALRNSIPRSARDPLPPTRPGGSRPTPGQPGLPPKSSFITGAITEIEKSIGVETGKSLQRKLCVATATGDFGSETRRAIALAKSAPSSGYNSLRAGDAKTDLLSINTRTQLEAFLDLPDCPRTELGVRNAYEALEFNSATNIDSLTESLNECLTNVAKKHSEAAGVKAVSSGKFTSSMRAAVVAIKQHIVPKDTRAVVPADEIDDTFDTALESGDCVVIGDESPS